MKFKIAVVQFNIKQFDVKKNLQNAENYIVEASKSKANIIVFPEDFITGPVMGQMEYADSNKKYVSYFKNLAKKYKIDIVTGSIIEKEEKGTYNVTYYVDSKGNIKSSYKKINLWIPERRYLTSGNEVSVFNTKYGKIGLIICWDLIFPEIFRKLAKKGVKIIICPSYWCLGDSGKGINIDANSEKKLIDALSVARAFENEIVFVFCNAAGHLEYLNKKIDTLVGHSQITMPFKGAVQKLNHNKQEMFIQEIDTKILDLAEKAYKIKKDLKNRYL
jgi:predicted amidohydrolase